jgi:hypothetical protein
MRNVHNSSAELHFSYLLVLGFLIDNLIGVAENKALGRVLENTTGLGLRSKASGGKQPGKIPVEPSSGGNEPARSSECELPAINACVLPTCQTRRSP